MHPVLVKNMSKFTQIFTDFWTQNISMHDFLVWKKDTIIDSLLMLLSSFSKLKKNFRFTVFYILS